MGEWSEPMSMDAMDRMIEARGKDKSMPPRDTARYVTSDGKIGVVLDIPRGMMPLPTIKLHYPVRGTVEFYWTAFYRDIEVDPWAYVVDRDGDHW